VDKQHHNVVSQSVEGVESVADQRKPVKVRAKGNGQRSRMEAMMTEMNLHPLRLQATAMTNNANRMNQNQLDGSDDLHY
jgi:hypothetical protein